MIGQAKRWIVPIAEADPADVATLGGKGASLATLMEAGARVPPAFVVSTELCRVYGREGAIPEDVWEELIASLALLETAVGRRFGNPAAPLLLSVRSGAPVSMPGMMDTILNVGLTDATVDGLAAMTGDEAFAWDSYCRLLKMFGASVRGLSAAKLALARAGRDDRHAPAAERHRETARRYQEIIASHSGSELPQDALAQLRESVEAVLRSWSSPRAQRYRAHHEISDDVGTAVVVQAMVFGNLDERSGSGVAFTRDPAGGKRGLYGDFLVCAQGEDVVSGEYEVGSLADCRSAAPDAWAELEVTAASLEAHYRDMCDIEFTIESGRLWVLQVRVGQRTGLAEVRIALDLLDEGVLTLEEALDRISPAGLIQAHAPVLEHQGERVPIGRGIAASPGAAVGVLATTAQAAEELMAAGRDVILVRQDTSPEDIAGFIAARGIVTARGGRVSHAAVVARGMNRPAVCSVREMLVEDESARFGSMEVAAGEPLSIDGTRGEVYAGRLRLMPRNPGPRVKRLMAACDARRRMPVLTAEPEEWADGTFEFGSATECRSAAAVATALEEGQPRLVVLPGEAEDPHGTLAAARGARAPVYVAVRGDWPAALRKLPSGNWAGIVAERSGAPAARLLAATCDLDH